MPAWNWSSFSECAGIFKLRITDRPVAVLAMIRPKCYTVAIVQYRCVSISTDLPFEMVLLSDQPGADRRSGPGLVRTPDPGPRTPDPGPRTPDPANYQASFPHKQISFPKPGSEDPGTEL